MAPVPIALIPFQPFEPQKNSLFGRCRSQSETVFQPNLAALWNTSQDLCSPVPETVRNQRRIPGDWVLLEIC